MNKKVIIVVVAVLVVGALAVLAIKYWSSYQTATYPANQATPSQQTEGGSGVTQTPLNQLPIVSDQVPTPTSTPAPKPTPIPTPAPVVTNKTYNIIAQNFAFSPASITINAGDTIIWTNRDLAPHTATGSGFDSGALSNGQSYSFKFSSAGTYNYYCAIHPSMTGVVIVK